MIEVFVNKTVEVVEVVVQNNQNIDCNITNNQSIIDVVLSELGSKGDTGNQGIKGDKGDTGSQGIQGEVGTQGPIGLTGPQGIQGIKGDTGNQGEDGNTNVFIQQTEPGLATPYIWYQTDATGSLVSIWINKV
jgi:hypothetical protein